MGRNQGLAMLSSTPLQKISWHRIFDPFNQCCWLPRSPSPSPVAACFIVFPPSFPFLCLVSQIFMSGARFVLSTAVIVAWAYLVFGEKCPLAITMERRRNRSSSAIRTSLVQGFARNDFSDPPSPPPLRSQLFFTAATKQAFSPDTFLTDDPLAVNTRVHTLSILCR